MHPSFLPLLETIDWVGIFFLSFLFRRKIKERYVKLILKTVASGRNFYAGFLYVSY